MAKFRLVTSLNTFKPIWISYFSNFTMSFYEYFQIRKLLKNKQYLKVEEVKEPSLIDYVTFLDLFKVSNHSGPFQWHPQVYLGGQLATSLFTKFEGNFPLVCKLWMRS